MPVTVCIFEDNTNLRESLLSLLSLDDSYEILGTFPDCSAVGHHVKELDPDVILMDIDMPGMNGIEAVKLIRTFNRTVQVIMLTIFDEDKHVFAALKAGANGYLLKKNISERLNASIREVMSGGAPMSPTIARMVIASMQPADHTDADYKLTPREKEILGLLSQGQSHKMIAASASITIETVRTHLKRVYDKLHVHSQTEAVSKAINEKLI